MHCIKGLLFVVYLQLMPVTIDQLFEINGEIDSTHHTVESNTADNSVSNLLSKLIWGQLIYPWMELTNKC